MRPEATPTGFSPRRSKRDFLSCFCAPETKTRNPYYVFGLGKRKRGNPYNILGPRRPKKVTPTPFWRPGEGGRQPLQRFGAPGSARSKMASRTGFATTSLPAGLGPGPKLMLAAPGPSSRVPPGHLVAGMSFRFFGVCVGYTWGMRGTRPSAQASSLGPRALGSRPRCPGPLVPRVPSPGS